jgi:hypothetical protein
MIALAQAYEGRIPGKSDQAFKEIAKACGVSASTVRQAVTAYRKKRQAEDFETFTGTYADAEAYVFSTNFLRRQLTAGQRNDVIKAMIEKYPAESNRQIARRCGLNSHSQVANVRERMNQPSAEQKRYTEFCKVWDALPDYQRAAFVKEFAPDLRELLAWWGGQNVQIK